MAEQNQERLPVDTEEVVAPVVESLPKKKSIAVGTLVRHISSHSGPLPDPETLEKYNRIIFSARRATSRERREYEGGESAVREATMTYEPSKHGPVMEDDPDMRVEYDFSNGIRGRFANSLFPVYIENRTLGYFHGQAIATGKSSEELINDVLRQYVAKMGYVSPVFAERR